MSAPSLANAIATARPIPESPPVIERPLALEQPAPNVIGHLVLRLRIHLGGSAWS